MLKNLDDLIKHVKSDEKRVIVVSCAGDEEILKVVDEASELADFILVGDKQIITDIKGKFGFQFQAEIVDESDPKVASEKSVSLINSGEAGSIMKGMLHTGTFLKAVLNKETGLNTGKKISQISVYNKPFDEGLQLLTDCAMAIEPTLDDKKQLIENAAYLAKCIGYDMPKVAVLSAVEVVNPAIKDSVEAAILSKMCERGQIKDCVVDGPFALDNAVSFEAAQHKGIASEVAGNADILLAPNLQVGNVLTKALTFFAKMDVAAAVIGASAPIIMTSRTDSVRNKLLSIALAAYISKQ